MQGAGLVGEEPVRGLEREGSPGQVVTPAREAADLCRTLNPSCAKWRLLLTGNRAAANEAWRVCVEKR